MKKQPEVTRGMIYYWNNRDIVLAKQRKRYYENREQRLNREKEYRQRIRLLVLNHYSSNNPHCACCGEAEIRFLTIDHERNNGTKHRKAIGEGSLAMYRWLINHHFPKGFRILCYNCNLGRAANGGICPHKKEIENGN